MEELKKCYQKLNELIQEIENRHEVRPFQVLCKR